MYESQDLSWSVPRTVDVYTISKGSAVSMKMSKTYGWFVFHLPKQKKKGVCPLGPHQVKS